MFLICPSLRELTISFPNLDWPEDVAFKIAGLFLGIFQKTRHLTHLRAESECYMQHDPEDEFFTPWQHPMQLDELFGWGLRFCDALTAVGVLEDLEIFSMITMDIGVTGRRLVETLSTLPKLRKCSFGLNISDDILKTITPGFTSLRVLAVSNVVHGDQLRLFDSFLLQDLTIYHAEVDNADSHRHTLDVITERFPNLGALTFDQADSRRHTLTVITKCFPNLQVLALSNVAYGDQLHLFDTPLLQDLTIYYANVDNAESHCHTFEVITEHFPHLRRLAWKPGHKYIPPTRQILSDCMPPLLGLESLCELSIDLIDRPVGDNNIAVLAERFPRLVHLDLKFWIDATGPSPSVQSLLLLTQSCSALQVIHLGGLRFTKEDVASTYHFVDNHLRCLSIADVRCAGTVTLIEGARSIDVLFPFLDIGRSRRRTAKLLSPKGSDTFLEVLNHLEQFHTERMQMPRAYPGPC